MKEAQNILGCFVSATQPYPDASQEAKDKALEQGRFFRTYIWGENGFCNTLKKLKHEDYGEDIKLVLLQFYVNPLPIEVRNLREIEDYRKKEKSIGIPIVVNDENFFSKSKDDRHIFVKHSILRKLDLLDEVVKVKQLDTKIGQLKIDVQKLLV